MAKHAHQPKLTQSQRRLRYAARKLLAAAIVAAIAGGLVLADRLGVFGRPAEGDRQKYHERSFHVARVIDGDTIELEVSDGRSPTTHVRLWGIDTPEIANKRKNKLDAYFGPEASEFTRSRCAGQTVTIKLEPGKSPRDKYQRLLAWVYLPDGRLLNRVLIEEGYGYADPGFDHHLKGEFRRLQDKAMRTRRGLWQDVTKDKLPVYYKDLELPAAKTRSASPETHQAQRR